MFKIIHSDPATRRFEMIISLSQGKRLHEMEEVEKIICSWLVAERAAKKIHLPGRLDCNTLLSLDKTGAVIKQDVAVYKGCADDHQTNDASDCDVIRSLTRLAHLLAIKLDLTHVSFTYRDTYYTAMDGQ